MLHHPNHEIQTILAQIDLADQNRSYDEMLLGIHALEETSLAQDDRGGLAAVRYYLACHKHLIYQKEEALRLGLEAVAYCQENQLPYYEMYAHNICGIICEDASDYGSSLDHYLDTYALARQTGQLDYAPYPLVNIGNLFMVLDDFENALIYMCNGLESFRRNPNLSPSDLRNMSVTVLNIIEALVGAGKDEEAAQWAREERELLETYQKEGIAHCFLLVGRADRYLRTGEPEQAAKGLRALLSSAINPKNLNDYYTLNILLSAFRIATQSGDQALAAKFLEEVERTRGATGLSTFDFKIQTVRVQYFERFFAGQEEYVQAKKFFYPFYQAGLALVQQLARTYANSLFVRTELERAETERRSVQAVNAQLRQSAEMDPFTGIYNKMSLRTHIEQKMAGMAPGQTAALLVIDIDNFKIVNDTFGHPVGDQVIEGFADILKGQFRPEDVVGRLGGDEFVVFLSGEMSRESVLARTETLLERMRDFRPKEAPLCTATLSIGICIFRGRKRYDTILARADKALYAAKQAGRDRYALAPSGPPQRR